MHLLARSKASSHGFVLPGRLRHLRWSPGCAALVVGLAMAAAEKAAAQSPGLELSQTALPVVEEASASYTVRLTALPTGDVTVSIEGASGTDLMLSESHLTFTTGNWSVTQTVTVSASQDDDATHDRVTLTHTASGGGYSTVTAELVVTVTDTTRLQLAAIIGSVTEGESQAIRASLPMPLDDQVTITVEVEPNGARDDEFELSANRTLTIAAGATQSTGEVIFTSLDDFTNTGTRWFNATLTADHPRVDPDIEGFQVFDDDKTITAWWVEPPTIFENGGEATLRARKYHLHQGVVKMALSIEPSDRATLSGTTLTFEPGAVYATEAPTITAVDNPAADGDQTITITATVIQGRGIQTPFQGPLELTIVDDDGVAPQVALKLTPPQVWEGLVSTVTAEASHPLDAEATITVAASPGHTDTLTSDYELSANTVLTIPAGGRRSTGTVTIATVDDELSVGSRRREVTVSGTLTGTDVAGPADQTLTILEDEQRAPIAIVATPAAILEGESSTVTLRALEPVPADVTVTIITYDQGVELSENTVLMIAQGQTASTGVVTATAVDDADRRNEVVTLLGTPSEETMFVTVWTTQVFVVDNDDDNATITVFLDPIFVLEGETSTVRVRLNQPLADDVTVTIGVDETHVDHTAAPESYTLSANRALTVPAGSLSGTGVVSLTVADDEYFGGSNHTRVYLDIVSVTGIDPAEVGVVKHGNWVIFDDELPPRVTLEVTPASISENGGRSTVTATLQTKLRTDAEVTITVSPVGTADVGDFTQSGTTVTIPAGEKISTGTVTISAVDDEIDGPDKHFVVTGTVTGQGVWFPLPEGLTILDDDLSGLIISPPEVTIDEGDDSTYTVMLNGEPAGPVDVTVTGTEGTDLTLSSSRPDVHEVALERRPAGGCDGSAGRRFGRRRGAADAHGFEERVRRESFASDGHRRRPGNGQPQEEDTAIDYPLDRPSRVSDRRGDSLVPGHRPPRGRTGIHGLLLSREHRNRRSPLPGAYGAVDGAAERGPGSVRTGLGYLDGEGE